jgi:hypothetical protein
MLAEDDTRAIEFEKLRSAGEQIARLRRAGEHGGQRMRSRSR